MTAIADVRSTPYSRFNPQFNREKLKIALEENQIAYLFLGKELGARSDNPDCHLNGKVQYLLLAKLPEFVEGLNRVQSRMVKYRLALMCAEKDPMTCHRTILVCRNLRNDNFKIQHILSDGSLESHPDLERRLVQSLGLEAPALFSTSENLINQAYDRQGEKMASPGIQKTLHNLDSRDGLWNGRSKTATDYGVVEVRLRRIVERS